MEWPETVSTDLKKAVEVLVLGRDLADELQNLLCKPPRERGPVTAEDLVAKITGTFTNALSILNSSVAAGETSQSPMVTQVGSPSSDDRKSGDSGEKRKIPGSKDRRGGYKRRKASHTWTTLTPTPVEDGYAWRKYGQKEILNAKHPRSYFRCTHKHDQGCQATKQVQRTEEDPPMFRTIYMGHHTCKDTLKAPQLILDSYPNKDSSCLLNFQTKTSESHHHKQAAYGYPFFTSLLSVKSESQHEIQSDLTHNQSSSEYLLSPDLTSFESSGPTSMLASTSGSDHGDVISSVYSSCTSHQSLGMDFWDAHGFDDVFDFDDEELT